MEIIELFKTLLIGIVEGITEWLPISSTGHMILFNEFVQLNVSGKFWEIFLVVIQLGAIMAVIVLYFHKLNPFARSKSDAERRSTLTLWSKVIIASIPAAVIGFLLDDWANTYFFNAVGVAIALIVYGVAFIVIERVKSRTERVGHRSLSGNRQTSLSVTGELNNLSFSHALLIGCFQCLAIIPGTSRSGSTILGGRILGVSRQVAAEFSFFLAIPVMFGWSLLKILKGFVLDHLSLSVTEWGVFAVGIIVAFVVSILAINFLIRYIKDHSFEIFGWYRIVLGIVILVFFAATGQLFNLNS